MSVSNHQIILMVEMKMNTDMWLRPEFMIVWIMHVFDWLASKVKKKKKVKGVREKKNMGLHIMAWTFQLYNLFKIQMFTVKIKESREK